MAGNSADNGAAESGAATEADAAGADVAAATEPGAGQAEDASDVLSVVSGNPTDEELAALTAVVVALQATPDADEPTTQGRSWLRRAMLRLGPIPGPGSWRRSNR